jgi:ABC-type nitrate/sulfonate/bicarbonate transport system permease component
MTPAAPSPAEPAKTEPAKADSPKPVPAPRIPHDTVVAHGRPAPTDAGLLRRLFALRAESPWALRIVLGILCLAIVLGIWWYLTTGPSNEERILSPVVLPSPRETFDREALESLWVNKALMRNTVASLQRVVLGYGLAAIIGVPIGVMCGCYGVWRSLFAPLIVFGRNAPIAALVGLTLVLFGTGEFQKIMFLFIACVAFVVSDTTTAILDVSSRYVDTALTLGAKRRQVITKVLVPLAMPNIFNSLRLLFGLAFGYIMLAELVRSEGEYGGLGNIINLAQSRGGQRQDILLVLILIPLVALGIDRILYWIQRQLFPHQYGSSGVLHAMMRTMAHAVEDMKALVIRPKRLETAQAAIPTSGGKR